jgi:SAM-dependent methyltransferase
MKMTVDFGKTSLDYSAHRPEFDPRLFTRLQALGVGLPDQKIVDIGAGTGLLSSRLSGNVIQCDVSIDLLKMGTGRRIAGCAESLPFAGETFDAIAAGQCWHWFNRLAAPREIARVLKPGGRIAIIYQTYLPIEGNIAAASEQIILRYRPRWRHAGGVGINGQALKDLQTARYTDIESFSFDVDIPFTRQQWQGYIRTCSAVGPSLSNEDLARFDEAHASALLKWPESFTVPHRVFAAVATRP